MNLIGTHKLLTPCAYLKQGGIMDFKFVSGLALGMFGGALIAANSVKARKMIKEGQEKVAETTEKVVNDVKGKKSKSK